MRHVGCANCEELHTLFFPSLLFCVRMNELWSIILCFRLCASRSAEGLRFSAICLGRIKKTRNLSTDQGLAT
uniref:Uncharacterized protein n=1 Tax=Rhizophora mucronata TaxID=61149 RepID=A0A2P2MGE8_RHIMU